MGYFEKSIETHEKSLLLNPKDSNLLIQMMYPYQSLRKYSKSVDALSNSNAEIEIGNAS